MPAGNICCPGGKNQCNPLTSKCCGSGGCVPLNTDCCSDGTFCVTPQNHCVILNGKMSCCKDSSCSDLMSTVKPITTIPTVTTVTACSIPRPTVTPSPITVQAPISTATVSATTVVVTPIVIQPSTTAPIVKPSRTPVPSVRLPPKNLLLNTVTITPAPNTPETRIITPTLVNGNTRASNQPAKTILLGDSVNPTATSLVLVNPTTPIITSIVLVNSGATAGGFDTARDQLNSTTTGNGGGGGARGRNGRQNKFRQQNYEREKPFGRDSCLSDCAWYCDVVIPLLIYEWTNLIQLKKSGCRLNLVGMRIRTLPRSSSWAVWYTARDRATFEWTDGTDFNCNKGTKYHDGHLCDMRKFEIGKTRNRMISPT